MRKSFFTRWIPTRAEIKQNKSLRFLGKILYSPEFWHFTRHSVATATFIGLFVMYLPLPFQTLIACALAIAFRGNILIAAALVWLSNPLTMAPIIYMSYKVGQWILQSPPLATEIALNTESIAKNLHLFWKPFLVGNLICALITAVIGYLIVILTWRWMKTHRHFN